MIQTSAEIADVYIMPAYNNFVVIENNKKRKEKI